MLRWSLVGVCLLGAFGDDLTAAEREATPVSSIRVHDGFRVELLRSAQPEEGSWISMTFVDDGTLVVAGDKSGLLRLKLGPTPEETTVEPIPGTDHLKHCRGVLFALGALYVSETNGQGIHRLKDADGDGVYEEARLICPLVYNSRYGHGLNQMTLGPDGMLYFAIGNDVQLPEGMDPKSPYRNPQNDWLLPNPHDDGQDHRVGYILKLSPDGSTRTVLAGGLRNQVDVAFNRHGELFTWDADMEWDVGLPWYRPTRINHIVSAGEYGWRWGSGKWPAWSPDSLPTTFDTALSSPTGLTFGTHSRWPERFQSALFAADWQNGRLLMIDLLEQGASYTGQSAVFAEGSPLNICDMEFGADGALYFITGGRGSQSGLYRIVLEDEHRALATARPLPERTSSTNAAAARQVRRELETLHVQQDASRLPLIWEHLGSGDPWIRFAARLALENQPVETWRDRITKTAPSRAKTTALMALARQGEPADQTIVLRGLLDGGLSGNDPEELLWELRTLQLTLIRQGMLAPDGKDDAAAVWKEVADKLHELPDSDRFAVHRLRCELLVALKSPRALAETVQQLEAAGTQEEQIQFVKTALQVRDGWTPEARQTVAQWLIRNRSLPGGKLVKTILGQFRDDFEQSLNDAERAALQQEIAKMREPLPDGENFAPPEPRPFVRNWTIDELDTRLEELASRPTSPVEGRKMLAAALCLRCHQFGDRGSHIGPDLTTVGMRMNRRTLLESITEPSREIDPKYHNSVYVLEDGQVITGRTTGVGGQTLTIETDALTGASAVIPRANIVESRTSPVSLMPQGLLNSFTAEEIHELLACLRTPPRP